MCVLLSGFSCLGSLSSANVFAAGETSGKCGDNATWNLDENGTLTISGQGAMYDYTNAYEKSIILSDGNAPCHNFHHRDSIKKLIIEDGITFIGKNPCCCTTYGEYIGFFDSITELEKWAFAGSDIESISIGKNVTQIDENAFDDCENLKFIYVSDDNPNYTSKSGNPNFDGKMLFAKQRGNKLKLIHCCNWDKTDNIDLIIPSNVSKTEHLAFNKCTGLKSVEFLGKIDLGYQSFYCCEQLEEIIFRDGISTANEWALFCCENLKLISGYNGVGRNIAEFLNQDEDVNVQYCDLENNSNLFGCSIM